MHVAVLRSCMTVTKSEQAVRARKGVPGETSLGQGDDLMPWGRNINTLPVKRCLDVPVHLPDVQMPSPLSEVCKSSHAQSIGHLSKLSGATGALQSKNVVLSGPCSWRASRQPPSCICSRPSPCTCLHAHLPCLSAPNPFFLHPV